MILESLLLKLHKDSTVGLPVAFHLAGGDGIRAGSGFFTYDSPHLNALRAHIGLFSSLSTPRVSTVYGGA